MNQISILYLILLLNQIFFILSVSPLTFLENPKNDQFNAVYRIDSVERDFPFIIQNNKVFFSSKKEGKEESFRIISTGTNKNTYYIISKPFNKKIGINDQGDLILYNIDDKENIEKTKWNFIKVNDKDYLLQNSFNKMYIEIKNKYENKKMVYYPTCTSYINSSESLEKVSKKLKYSFFKLCEEVQLKPEHIEIIEKEPVDVLIKYIDLTDKTLNRNGITQIKKDEDNEELKYCVRSILEYIPWVRKIFILMPNDKVKYFKPINEIKDKFVYVKDKDVIGFDSANSVTFQLNLCNMVKFGLSENFILMDDDYFIGKPIKKTDFFYYDENTKKVVPSVITDDFTEMIKTNILNEYNKLYRRKTRIKPHSFNGWKISQLASYKLLLEQFPPPLINAGFSHNAISLNIHDLIEIHELIKNKYQYAKDVLTAKIRTVYDLQPQSLFSAYALNVKKRKVNSIPYAYYDISSSLDKNNYDIELFVLNTSGDRTYTKAQYDKEKDILNKKFPNPSKYEIQTSPTKKVIEEKKDLNNNDKKDDYNTLKNQLEKSEKINKELNDKIDKLIIEKKYLEKQLKDSITYILENIKERDKENYTSKYIHNISNIQDEKNEKENLKNYKFFKNFFIIMMVLFLLSIFICLFYLCYIDNYKNLSDEKRDNLIKSRESFTKLSTEDNI